MNESTDAVISTVLAGQLGPEHMGKRVAFHTPEGHRFGVLEAVYRPRQGVRTLTLGGHRHHDIPSTTEVDVITREASA